MEVQKAESASSLVWLEGTSSAPAREIRTLHNRHICYHTHKHTRTHRIYSTSGVTAITFLSCMRMFIIPM